VNGSEFPGTTDTCFALLFLRKVNVAKDLNINQKVVSNPDPPPLKKDPPPKKEKEPDKVVDKKKPDKKIKGPVIDIAPGIIDLEDTKPGDQSRLPQRQEIFPFRQSELWAADLRVARRVASLS
jgi:hypothetical protein